MSVSVAQILESPQFNEALTRMREGLTQKILSQSTDTGDRERLLMKYHLIDELEVDLTLHKET